MSSDEVGYNSKEDERLLVIFDGLRVIFELHMYLYCFRPSRAYFYTIFSDHLTNKLFDRSPLKAVVDISSSHGTTIAPDEGARYHRPNNTFFFLY